MQSQENNKARGKGNTPDLAKEKKNQLTVTLFVGEKQVEELTAEQREKMSQRLSKAMGVYYCSRMGEYGKISNGQ